MTQAQIIRGGMVADGAGGKLQRLDVAVADGKIVDLGTNLGGENIIDAHGAIVSPGFIDIHTHYDAQLFWDPACTPSSWHGVTTAIIGNCGFALAPNRPETRELLVQMLVDQEDMPADVLHAGLDWSFTNFSGFLDSVASLKPSINVAAYVGHSPVRIEVMRDAAYERAANAGEIAAMARIVEEAMEAGAIGFASTSSPSGRRSATGNASEQEIVTLGQAMGSAGRGVMALVPGGQGYDHARVYEFQRTVGRPITWTALMAMPDGNHARLSELHARRFSEGADVHPQVSSRPQVAMTTMRRAFALRVPSMLALEGASDEVRLATYKNPNWVPTIEAEMPLVRFPVSWDRWVLSDSPSAPQLTGRTLADIAAERGKSSVATLFDLVIADELETRFTIVQFNYDEDAVANLLNLDGAVLGLADSGAHPDQICDAVLPTDFLGKWVRDKAVMPIEKAVRKLTGEPADLFGLDRGYIRKGAPADIVVFEPDTISPGPLRRVWDMPAGGERLIGDQLSGIRHVLVNGDPIRTDGKPLNRSASGGSGMVIRDSKR